MLLNPGNILTFQQLHQAYLAELNALANSQRATPKDFDMLVQGSEILGRNMSPYYIDFPFKDRNNLYYLTVPYFEGARFTRKRGVVLLTVGSPKAGNVDVHLVFYAKEGKKNTPAYEFTLESDNSYRQHEHMMIRLSRGFFGREKVEISPYLTSNQSRFSTMVNQF